MVVAGDEFIEVNPLALGILLGIENNAADFVVGELDSKYDVDIARAIVLGLRK